MAEKFNLKFKSQCSPADVYDVDENGKFFLLLPAKMFKDVDCHSCKTSHDSFICMVCTNMSGNDEPIGKSINPRRFKNLKLIFKDHKAKNTWIKSERRMQRIEQKNVKKPERVFNNNYNIKVS